MARIPILREDDSTTPEQARQALRDVGGARGQVVNLYRALASHPAALRAYLQLREAVRGPEGGLTPKQQELAYTTATVVNQCYY